MSSSHIFCAWIPVYVPTSAESIDPACYSIHIFRRTGLGSGCVAPVQLLVVMPVPWQLCCPCAPQLAYSSPSSASVPRVPVPQVPRNRGSIKRRVHNPRTSTRYPSVSVRKIPNPDTKPSGAAFKDRRDNYENRDVYWVGASRLQGRCHSLPPEKKRTKKVWPLEVLACEQESSAGAAVVQQSCVRQLEKPKETTFLHIYGGRRPRN